MKNTFGTALSVTIFGESHGAAIGAVIDGLTPGVKVDLEYISKKLQKRRPSGTISTQRREADEVKLLSGVFQGYTTGTPIAIVIENHDTRSGDYSELCKTPRPSHADFSAECKYHGFQDYRGGGHFSGRVTAALVAAGALIEAALMDKGIYIGTQITRLHGIAGGEFSPTDEALIKADIDMLDAADFPALKNADKMREVIQNARDMGDSVGGILQTAVIGCPCGVGEPYFDTFEGVLSHILFSVPAIKGVEFGDGFALCDEYGSEANDAFITDGVSVKCKTNHQGGINGGITNGMPVIFRTAVKPTPSIFKSQDTVNLATMQNTTLSLRGRHDPAIIHRAAAVVDASCAIALCDMLLTRYGTDYLSTK